MFSGVRIKTNKFWLIFSNEPVRKITFCRQTPLFFLKVARPLLKFINFKKLQNDFWLIAAFIQILTDNVSQIDSMKIYIPAEK